MSLKLEYDDFSQKIISNCRIPCLESAEKQSESLKDLQTREPVSVSTFQHSTFQQNPGDLGFDFTQTVIFLNFSRFGSLDLGLHYIGPFLV